MAGVARHSDRQARPIAANGSTAHYDFDGSLTDQLGPLSARPHTERRSDVSARAR